jgi:methyl-accepting chemotaxis protein
VVANEVRALAQRSADAAKDIKELITESSGQVMMGVDLVAKTGAVLERIVGKVGDISTLITEIAQSAEAQASNLVQINVAVADMDKMTQQNAAMVEESTAAARSLAGEADQLSTLVGRFTIGNSGGNGRAAVSGGGAVGTVMRLSATSRRRGAPGSAGNLALKATDGEDWSAF